MIWGFMAIGNMLLTPEGARRETARDPTMRKGKRETYQSKTFTLPSSQIKWIRRLKAAALIDPAVGPDFQLFESTVAREAFDRLIRVGEWPELKGRLLKRWRDEPRPGRPKAG
jgi:hypothetical protein